MFNLRPQLSCVKKDVWVRKGKEHEGRLLGLKLRMGRVVSGRSGRLDYEGPVVHGKKFGSEEQ